MKNPFTTRALPWVAFGAGVVGFWLQLWLHTAGIDPSGLYLASHPAFPLMCILLAAVVGIVLSVTLPLKGTPVYKRMFPPSLIPALGCVIAAIGLLSHALATLLEDTNTLGILYALSGVLGAISLVYHGIVRSGLLRFKYNLYPFFVVHLMFHLVLQYTHWSSQPQLQNYFFQLMASVISLIAFYYRTCLATGQDVRRQYAFFHFTALFLCCVALYSGHWLHYLSLAIVLSTDQMCLRTGMAPVAMVLPENVRFCIDKLEENGFSAYVVGGCVRDAVLGIAPHDYDMCTNAQPEQIIDVFSSAQLLHKGEKHGTIGVVLGGEVYEITTFRTEGGYTDNRHPDWVKFVNTIEEDLARRDFTVNAMAYSPSTGYIDPWGGQEDLENHVLRAVGNASTRFREDPLRILRGIRFSVTYKLQPEAKTMQAMCAEAHLIETLSQERIFSELCRILPTISAQELLHYAPILAQVIPELAPAVGFDQHSPHHAYDVFTHTAKVVEAVMPELTLRWAALLHDVGKPATFTTDETGRGHFYGHAQAGAQIADQILQRLKAPTALRNQVVFLIEHHMTPFEPDKKSLRRTLSNYGEDTALLLLDLQKADFSSKGVVDEHDPFPAIDQLLEQIQAEDNCLSVKQLAINGHDLLALGQEPGPHIGQCMAFLLELVQDEIVENTREDLLQAAQNFFENE